MTEIRSTSIVAEFDAGAGGRLSRLRWRRASGDMFDVVVPMQSGLDGCRWPKAGAYPLIPYSNRIARSELRFEGRMHRLEPHPDAFPHTLHGHTQLLPWQCSSDGSSAELTLSCNAGAAWPWAIEARQRFVALPEGLSIELSIRNVDRTPMPAGLGWHPFLVCGAGARFEHGARSQWPHDRAYLPIGHEEALASEWQAAGVPDTDEKTGYLGQWSGGCALHHANGVSIRMSADSVFDHLVVHRPAGRHYLCVEPVTHVADAFNLSERDVKRTGSQKLEAGQTLEGRIVLSCSEHPEAAG